MAEENNSANQAGDTVVFPSVDLQDEGKGLRFALPELGQFATGFVIRYHGHPYAYVNQCAHVPVELDWNHGDFFTREKDFLICSTHGAHYQPETGYCVMGPCKGKNLKPIPVTEQDQKIIINIASISR